MPGDEGLQALIGAISNANRDGEKPFRIGTALDYDAAKGVYVWFDGEGASSQRPYRRLASYTYVYGERVLMARVGSTWVVLGALAI